MATSINNKGGPFPRNVSTVASREFSALRPNWAALPRFCAVSTSSPRRVRGGETRAYGDDLLRAAGRAAVDLESPQTRRQRVVVVSHTRCFTVAGYHGVVPDHRIGSPREI